MSRTTTLRVLFTVTLLLCFVPLLKAQTGCCRPPDSLKLVSITTNRFCVSWKVKDSFPCDSVISSIIQFRKVGTTTWTTRTVNFPKGQKLINFCDSVKPCTKYQWQVRNVCKKIDSSFSSYVSGPNFTTFCDTSSCCNKPDSLKLVSYSGNNFCVSWNIKDSMPCDSSIGATIRYKWEGSAVWKTVDVTYTAGAKKYTYCDTATKCRYYDWQVRTKCKRAGVITYSAYVIGSQFINTSGCGPLPRGVNPAVTSTDSLLLRITPNPVTSEITVFTNKALSGNVSVQIIDALGRTRFTRTVVARQKPIKLTMNTDMLKGGLYYILLSGAGENAKTSFIKY